jgi:NodT family efflux transporter outer membrane factor (OMF) lipoprotein
MLRDSIRSRLWRGIDMNDAAPPSATGARLRYAIGVVAVLALTGCALTRTHYARPSLDIPSQWRQPGQPVMMARYEVPATAWWERFRDPALDALVERALEQNANLAAAAQRVHQAELEAQLARSQLLPVVSAQASYSEARTLYTPAYTTRTSATALTASYEVNLWGRLSAVSDAARWEAQATEQDRKSTALSLIGTLVQLYWQSAYVSQLVTSGEASIDYSEQTLQLVEVQYRAGEVSELEVAQARQSLESQRADLAQLRLEQTQTADALALLFDVPPERAPPVALQNLDHVVLPPVEPGLPAAVLSRRPDVHAAELRLRESLANVDATRLSFYPTLTLTGSLGTGSTGLTQILKYPVATLGAGVVLPFIQWREMGRTIDISKAEYQQAVVMFRQTFYSALSDVENALSARAQLAQQDEALSRALKDATTAEHLNEAQFRAGEVALTSWLDAQQARRVGENAWALNRFNELSAQVALYQALGGG